MVKVIVSDALVGKQYEFEVRKSDTVKEFRDRVLTEAKKAPGRDYVTARHLRLMHMGQEMKDRDEGDKMDHQVFFYRIDHGSKVMLLVRPKEADEPSIAPESQAEDVVEHPAEEKEKEKEEEEGEAADSKVTIPPIEQEHLDQAIAPSLVNEGRNKVKLVCTTESGDDVLPHEEGIPVGTTSRIRRVFKFDAELISQFRTNKGKYICFDLNGADLPNPDNVGTHCIMRRRKELPTSGTNLALWLIYRNAQLDKMASTGLPKKKKEEIKRASGAKNRGAASSLSSSSSSSTTSEGSVAEESKENIVLAFKLTTPEDFEDGYYTLGVIDDSAPDEPCEVCRKHTDADKTLLCDQCGEGYHIYCLDPPLPEVPAEDVDWYCPNCFNDPEAIKAKISETKRAKSLGAKSKKGWGGGMSTASAQKCTIVPPDYSGQIPGTYVGQIWKYRGEAHSAGVHRGMVAGIAGNLSMGKVVSIVMAGGYEDDDDQGDEFVYTGSGGRNLKDGNKRTSKQDSDQKFDKLNLALAMNCVGFKHKCNKKFEGHVCDDCQERWREGLPIRVLRSEKAVEFGPKVDKGYRYDGLYKVIDFWYEVGKSGFKMCRYRLRRDDPSPAPWTPAGKAFIKKMSSGQTQAREERRKLRKIRKLVERDALNKRAWDDLIPKIDNKISMAEFVSEVENAFSCMICHSRVDIPITFPCTHNICQSCFAHFKSSANKYQCAMCRADVTKEFVATAKYNEPLVDIFAVLFPNSELPPNHKVHEVEVSESEEEMEAEEAADQVDVENEGEEGNFDTKKPAKRKRQKKEGSSSNKKARQTPLAARKQKEKEMEKEKEKEKKEKKEKEVLSVDEMEEEDDLLIALKPKIKPGREKAKLVDSDSREATKRKRGSDQADEKEEPIVLDVDEDDFQPTRKKRVFVKQDENKVIDLSENAECPSNEGGKSKNKTTSDAVEEPDIGEGWDLWQENDEPCRELTDFSILWKSRSFIDVERIGEGHKVRALGSLVPPENSPHKEPIRVHLPEVIEWTLDYTNECLWLRTPIAWYKLDEPLPEYAPMFVEARTKFEICNHLHHILEEEDHADIGFDAVIAKLGEVSEAKYGEDHVLKRAAFIEEKLKEFDEAKATKQKFIKEMKKKKAPAKATTPASAGKPKNKKTTKASSTAKASPTATKQSTGSTSSSSSSAPSSSTKSAQTTLKAYATLDSYFAKKT